MAPPAPTYSIRLRGGCACPNAARQQLAVLGKEGFAVGVAIAQGHIGHTEIARSCTAQGGQLNSQQTSAHRRNIPPPRFCTCICPSSNKPAAAAPRTQRQSYPHCRCVPMNFHTHAANLPMINVQAMQDMPLAWTDGATAAVASRPTTTRVRTDIMIAPEVLTAAKDTRKGCDTCNENRIGAKRM